MRIAIIARPDFRSPRVLAESLKVQIEKTGNKATLFFEIDVLTRLNGYKESKISFSYWLRKKVSNFLKDRSFLNRLKFFDVVVISECTPNGFWKHLYNVEKLKRIIKRPVLFYEVYYLGNAPTQIKKLIIDGDALMDRYDWHLSVSDITEIRTSARNSWTCIGIDLSNTLLRPKPKKEFSVLVDFPQPGYAEFRLEQVKILKKLNIKTIFLNGNYSTEQIRQLYQEASVFLMQSSEAFGLPLAENLACGTQIFTADSSWPMSWRLDLHPEIHGGGTLPVCFTEYKNGEGLANNLVLFRNNYNLVQTPIDVFNQFIKHYPHYYYGNQKNLQLALNNFVKP